MEALFGEAGVRPTPERLRPALPAALEVHEFWCRRDPRKHRNPPGAWRWEVEPASPEEPIRGPGGLWVHHDTPVPVLALSARWRGFLSLPRLRRVHMEAVTAVAAALGRTRTLLLPESHPGSDAVFTGAGFEEVRSLLLGAWGPPLRSVSPVPPLFSRGTPPRRPACWFDVDLKDPNPAGGSREAEAAARRRLAAAWARDRRRTGLSIKELAAKSRVPVGTLRRLEAGTRFGSSRTRRRVDRALRRAGAAGPG